MQLNSFPDRLEIVTSLELTHRQFKRSNDERQVPIFHIPDVGLV